MFSPQQILIMKRQLLKLAMAVFTAVLFFSNAVTAATVSWVGGSGDWTNTANWSTGALPGTNDDVVISPAATITVTHSAGTHFVKSIQSRNEFVLSGGLLAVTTTLVASNTFTLSGGTLQSATVVTADGATLLAIGGTLDGVTLNANAVVQAGNACSSVSLTVTNGLTLNGTLTLQRTANNSNTDGSVYLSFMGGQTLGGTGQVVFGDTGGDPYGCNGALYLQSTSGTLTIGPGITIHGQRGYVGNASLPLVNYGTILSDSGFTITVQGNSVTNFGAVAGVSNSTVTLSGGLANAGILAVTNATLNLPGSLTTAQLGTVQNSNGVVNLLGTLDNTGSTLTLTPATGSLQLNGAKIRGGTVNGSGGAGLVVVGNSTLDGVTLNANAVVQAGNACSSVTLTVTNGLTLNGTLTLQRTANNSNTDGSGYLSFMGGQTLGGTGQVVFGDTGGALYGCHGALYLQSTSGTLTIGPGITIHGQRGYVGNASLPLINQGTISADVAGATITINGQPFANQGVLQSAGGTLNLACTMSPGTMGTIQNLGGNVFFSGVLNNVAQTFTVGGSNAVFTLNGATIQGGVINSTNGSALAVSGSAFLDDVTINGILDVGSSYSGAVLTVTNGLTVNGLIYVGASDSGNYGRIDFAGSQALGGSGNVILGQAANANLLRLPTVGTLLTLGPNITVHGRSGVIGSGANTWAGGPTSVSVVNQGLITADVAGGTITLAGSSVQNLGVILAAGGALSLPSTGFQNTGTLEASAGGVLNVPQMPSASGNIIALAGGTVNLPSLIYFNGLNLLSSQPGGTVQVGGSILGNTHNLGQFSAMGTLVFNGSGTAASPQLLEVMGQDVGTSQLGFIHNFNYGTIALTNHTYVQLVNQYQNSSSSSPEALYVNSLVVPSGNTLDLNGLHVYARSAQIGGIILHGSVTQIPNTGTIGVGNPTLGNIAAIGIMDEWTFFARAGQFYTVVVDPASGSGVSPYLNYVEVKVINTNNVALASQTNSSSGTVVFLSSIAITNDGVYRVQVHASPVSPSSIGHYLVTVWQTTPNVNPLALNQTVSGSIQTPYSVDQWTFGAGSNSQVRFHLMGLSGTGIGFDLNGPYGWKGFTNLVGDSDFVTLPASGSYSILAHSLSGQYGAIYAFQLLGTAITNLTQI